MGAIFVNDNQYLQNSLEPQIQRESSGRKVHGIALVAGSLFGAGLSISQMTDPGKVIGFLDVSGDWDPSLALVMIAALTVYGLAYWLFRPSLGKPVLATEFSIPAPGSVDRRLLAGASLFGVGWGLTGICPGPALANIWLGIVPVGLFIAAMLAGMILFRILDQWQERRE